MLLSIFFSGLIYAVLGDGEFLIIHSPPSVKFQGDEPIDQSLVPEVISSSLGFTTKEGSDWPGLTIIEPFNYAEAAVIIVIEGISSLGKSKNFKKFPLSTNQDEAMTWKTVSNQIISRFPAENNTLLRTELDNSSGELGSLETTHLDKKSDEDSAFLHQLAGLRNFADRKEAMNGIPDVYWLVMSSLHPLTDMKGAHSAAVIEAKQMVHEALITISEKFSELYEDRVLVAAMVTDALHTRRTRSVDKKTEGDNNSTDFNFATNYHPDYPAVFNIMLWFTVISILSLVAISYFIATMDPGRDSIIYRMTSNRMKKDS